jgi:type I restriction enzyme S subunit
MSELAAELAAELAKRELQYKSYLEHLISNSTFEMVSLSNIATEMYRGAGIKRDEVTSSGIPCLRYGEIYTSYDVIFDHCISHTNESVVKNPKYFEHGDVIFAITGEDINQIAKSIVYMGHEKCMVGGDTVVMKHLQEPRYIAYALSTIYAQKQKSKGKSKNKVVHSSVPELKKIQIPLPDINTQKEIANKLDYFRSICKSITNGLPAEIDMRQKQYEYYRNKLLTFKELKKEDTNE